jgi:hypothetical protein
MVWTNQEFLQPQKSPEHYVCALTKVNQTKLVGVVASTEVGRSKGVLYLETLFASGGCTGCLPGHRQAMTPLECLAWTGSAQLQTRYV